MSKQDSAADTTSKPELRRNVPSDPWVEGAVEREGLLYRVPYLVLPRVLIGNMPLEWQEQFVKLMDELRDEWDWSEIVNDYSVMAKDGNKFVKDPLRDYRHFPLDEVERLRAHSALNNGSDLAKRTDAKSDGIEEQK